ncbi:GNAT family N-acetyltransferase [Salinimicrobium sp. HB62]|uniref:GNAT family N-acetyltransferase n=1 Tax=Salinimicrobium sp. HB62 TaxID=3077781 RepID=UPI002D770417|nr:GNAT family N-acetyltransferase [Salinimicrobium sp. HB62]
MPAENVIFEKLSSGDLQELKEISRKTFTDAFGADNNPEDLKLYLNTAFGEENLRQELLNPLSEFYFAKLNGETVGYFKINLGDAQTDFREEDGMELERIYVRKDFQNKKIGQKMLDTVIEMAIQRKMRYLWLGVWEKNSRAIEFYKRNFFKLEGSHPYMVGNDRQTDKIMKLFL